MMNTKLIISSVAITTVIFTIVFVFQIQPEVELESKSDIIFVIDPLITFKPDYQYDRIENGDLKYLSEAQKKLDKSNSLPIVSTNTDGNMEAIQLGLSPEIFDTMTEIEIADRIRKIVDVTVYVFSEEAIDHNFGLLD